MNKIEALNEKALEAARTEFLREGRPMMEAVAEAIRAYLTASDAERDPVAWPRIMYVCEYCQENNPEMCGHDRTDLHVTPDGRWLCDACLEDDGAPIADCSSPPLLYLDPPPTSELEAENARLKAEVERLRELASELPIVKYALRATEARLAEAMKALEKSENLFEAISHHIDEHSFSFAKGFCSQGAFTARRVREGGKVE